MIDQQLIFSGIQQAKQSLKAIRSTKIDGLYCVDNFFTDQIIEKLNNYCSNSNDKQWKTAPSYKQSLLRNQINWDPDTVVEEVYEILSAQTQKVNEVFNQQPLKFSGLNLWRDQPGYFIPLHTDNPVIIAALQIYLTESKERDLGTEFVDDDKTVNVAGKINCGYLAYNGKPIKHKSTSLVPKSIVRYSLYGIWTKS